MDRIVNDLIGEAREEIFGDAPAIPLNDDEERLTDHAARRMALPERLFHLNELDVWDDPANSALWTFMRPTGRPSFTPTMLADFALWQQLIASHFGAGKLPLDYLVLGSRSPGVFCFGGDLELFQSLIRAGDREGLANYGYRCVEILHRNMLALNQPMLTIGLVQGQALGGGFEALLSFDVLIAERGATFGLPEVAFGLFPGMGAHAFLSRKLGTALADRMILSNITYSAEDMYDMGIVTELAEEGEGVAAVRKFITKSHRRHSGLVHARKAMRRAAPIELTELRDIVDLWADAALCLSESDLKLMRRLAGAQAKIKVAA
jgi:DSF synthase